MTNTDRPRIAIECQTCLHVYDDVDAWGSVCPECGSTEVKED